MTKNELVNLGARLGLGTRAALASKLKPDLLRMIRAARKG